MEAEAAAAAVAAPASPPAAAAPEANQVTTEGLTVESYELLPGSDEFQEVVKQFDFHSSVTCLGVSVIKPWSTDMEAFTAYVEGQKDKRELQLFYRPPANVDLHDVLQYGFPPSKQEAWVEGDVSVEGGLVFSQTCGVAFDGSHDAPATVLVCRFAPGDEQESLEHDGSARVISARESGVVGCGPLWVSFGVPLRVLPRYLVRLAPVFSPLPAADAFHSSPSVFGPRDESAVRVQEDLGGAIAKATDGQTLVVEGVFRETIVLEGKSLRLVGGEGKALIKAPPEESGGKNRPTAVIRVAGPHRFVLEGLTVLANKRRDHTEWKEMPEWSDVNPVVKGYRKDKSAAKRQGCSFLVDLGRCANCVEVTDGVLMALIDGCRLQGGSEVSGGSRARFRESQLVDGVVNGLYVTGSSVWVERCDIARHDSANVAVEDSSEARFEDCRIFGSRSTGVYLFNKACPVFERCEIFANLQTAIQMEGKGTDPTIRRCRIHHGEQYGMFITSEASGTVEGNHFYANHWAAIATTEGGNPIVRLNNMYRGFHYGFYSFDNGLGRVMHNWIHHNKDASVSVASSAAPHITDNEIYGGHSYGVYFFLKGMGRVEGNRICAHHAANVCITYDSDPEIVRNRIYSGETEGVAVMQEGRGRIEENELFNNYEANVSIQYEGNPVVRRNKIYNSKKTGVCCMHKAHGVVEDNDIFGSEYSGVALKTGADTVVRGNHMHDNGRYAVLVQMNGRGLVERNRMGPNTMGSLRVWGDSFPVIRDNNFLDDDEKSDTRFERDAPPSTPPPPKPEQEKKAPSFTEQLALTAEQVGADMLARQHYSGPAPPPALKKKARKKSSSAPRRGPPPPPPRNTDLIAGERYEAPLGLNGI